MNVSEKVRALLAGQRSVKEQQAAAREGSLVAGDRRRREPSGRDLRRWARSQERAGVKERKPAAAAQMRRQRKAAPTARELFPGLRAKRLAARPVLGYTEGGTPVFGPSVFRNVIDAEGKHV